MGYHEVNVRSSDAKLHIEGAAISDEYTIDRFGMDDGLNRAPDATFRFLFQIGSGYMIYLYVVCAMHPGSPDAFHTFWVKDCAVAEIEMEEYGAPSKVVTPGVSLPPVYERMYIERAGADWRSFAVRSMQFSAAHHGVQTLEMRIGLEPLAGVGAEDGGASTDPSVGAELRWSFREGWSLIEGGAPQPLVLGDRLRFEGPRPG